MAPLMVRWATRWDRKIMVEMVGALARQHGLEVAEETLGAAFEHALANPDRMRVAVAQSGDTVVGTASLHEHYSSWHASAMGSIEDFFVQPQMRGQGVGTALLNLLVQEAQRRGYCRIELQVQEDNDAAWKFYESHGLRFSGYLVYELDLQGEAEGSDKPGTPPAE